jgi:NADH-quinone oxidoreductase subunit L
VGITGACTAVFAASIGLVQNDIKRVLAYSTISQLGYMFLACGVGAFGAGIFHLTTHAFFKALLFLGAGSVMHAMAGNTDMRRMGALKSGMPGTYWTFLVAALALCGIFPLSGFFSKDEILWKALTGGGFFFWLVGAATAFVTAIYMFRAFFLTFHGPSRVDHNAAHHSGEPRGFTLPLIILAVLSAIGGLIGIPIIEHGNRLEIFLAPVLNRPASLSSHNPGLHDHSLEITMMAVSVLIAVAGISLAYLLYVRAPHLPERLARKFRTAYVLILNKYWIDEIYHILCVVPLLGLAQFLWKFVDDILIDGAVNGVAIIFRSGSSIFRRLQTGNVQNYALMILAGIVAILGYILLKS